MVRQFLPAALAILALSVAACERKPEPEPQPTETSVPISAPTAAQTAEPSPGPAPSPSVSPLPKLDMGAIDERRDPDRVLRFYSAALRARNWSAAAGAWGKGSGVTAATLKAAYDRPEAPVLEVGKGTQEGAAGSLYYEAPVVLRFGEAAPEKGSLTLRRVNDVDGATPAQLRWHIERATIGVGQ